MFILGLTIFSDFPLFPFLSLSLFPFSPLSFLPSQPLPSPSLSKGCLRSWIYRQSSLKAMLYRHVRKVLASNITSILFLLHLDFASWLPSFPCLMVNHVVIVNHTPMARYFLVIQNSRVLFSHTFERFFPFSFSSLLLFFRPPPVESNFHTPLSLIFV